MRKYIVYFFIYALLQFPLQSQSINTDVVAKWPRYSDAQNALYHYLSGHSYELLKQRHDKIAQLHTKADWEKRQQDVKKTLNNIIGPFPEKTPLNVQITGRMERDDFRVEKLIYESQPGFYVTAALFIPAKLKGKRPAVIYCSGHTDKGFRSPVYQRVIINLVKKGFVVLAYDPVGQGERMEYYDVKTGKSKVGGPTKEHSYAGAQCFLIGSSEARYMIWDGIRTVDYLMTRKEVDPQRIGITGRSGGGTQSSYIAAMDERIKAAAPECYITSLTRLLESKGLQDAEQNLYHGILNGIDHADLLEVRAPKPTMVIATTRDFFSIQGVYETVAEAKKVFKAYGKEDNISFSVDEDKHASTKKNREALYHFFQKYLNNPGDAKDEDVVVFDESELYATESGQVSVDLQGETVYSLNEKEYQKEFAGKKTSDPLTAAKELSGYKRNIKDYKAVFCGSYTDSGITVLKYFIEMDGGYPLPFILLRPQDDKKHSTVIYLTPQGKKIYEKENTPIRKLVEQGNVVLLPDLLGFGETGGGKFRGDSYGFKQGMANYNIWFNEIQTGRSLCAIHAADISTLIDFLEDKKFVDNKNIYSIAENDLCPSLTYAAAFDERICKIVLISPFISYKSLLINRFYKPQFMCTAVGGMLPYYDLDDLYASIMPRKLLLLNVTDHFGSAMSSEKVAEETVAVKSTNASKNAGNFMIRHGLDNNSVYEFLMDWMK